MCCLHGVTPDFPPSTSTSLQTMGRGEGKAETQVGFREVLSTGKGLTLLYTVTLFKYLEFT